MGLLKDVHPFIAEILEGKHDEILRSVEAAVTHRRKIAANQSGIRPGAAVRVVDDPSNGRWAGREGIVRKVNPKSIAIDLKCPACGSAKALADDVRFGPRLRDAPPLTLVEPCKVCWGAPDGLRVSSAKQLELVTA